MQTSKEAVEVIDCGAASEQTKGVQLFITMEFSIPPWIYNPCFNGICQ
jgi:hypothetical protein